MEVDLGLGTGHPKTRTLCTKPSTFPLPICFVRTVSNPFALTFCSCLCFERVGRAIRDPERFLISLKMVKTIVKAKPFAVLPGSGMSIEVTLKQGEKVGDCSPHPHLDPNFV